MPFDRESALRNADKALKLGKLDQAIAEYASIVTQQPRDLSTANLLGDLYARAGQIDKAMAEYARIGAQYLDDGFLPKASALFKKALKLRPDDENALLQLGRIAGRQGLLADARSYMNAVAAQRRARGDEWGADDVVIELAAFDSSDVDTRMQAARTQASRGQGAEAAASLRELAIDLLEKERAPEAVDVLRETVHLVPGDLLARRQLISLLHDLDQASEAEVYLTREVAGDDPVLLFAVARVELETGRHDEGREDLRRALAHPPLAEEALRFMQQITPRLTDAGVIVADVLVDAALAAGRVAQAVEVLQWVAEAAPARVEAPLRLVELCIEEGLDAELPRAQGTLADAYLAAGDHGSARMMAEDLALAAPHDEQVLRRLVRVYQAAGVDDAESAARAFVSPPERVDSAEPVEPAEPAEPVVPVAPVRSAEPVTPAEPRAEVPAPEPPPRAASAAESEDDLIAKLLAEEASREEPAPAPAAPLPEIDLTASLNSLDAPEPAAAPSGSPPAGAADDDSRARARAEDAERAEAAYEEALMAAALGQHADAEQLYGEAARSMSFRFRAAAALARMLRDQGRLAEAIEWFERAGEAPAPDREEGLALLYDLGDTLERHGEGMRAMAIFMELNAEADDYRGVAARIDRLGRAEIGG